MPKSYLSPLVSRALHYRVARGATIGIDAINRGDRLVQSVDILHAIYRPIVYVRDDVSLLPAAALQQPTMFYALNLHATAYVELAA